LHKATILNTNIIDPGIEQSEQHQRVEDELKLLDYMLHIYPLFKMMFLFY